MPSSARVAQRTAAPWRTDRAGETSMKCLTEFACCRYVDRELSAEETRQVEAHLTLCPSCQALVEALAAESRLLSNVLQSVELEAVPVASDWRVGLRILLGFLSMVGVAAAAVTAVTWI